MRAHMFPGMAAESIMLGPAIAGDSPAQTPGARDTEVLTNGLPIRIAWDSLEPGLPLPARLLLR